MGKTLEVIKNRKQQKNKQVMPIEIVQGVYLYNMPPLASFKLLYRLIEEAGSDFNEQKTYRISLNKLNDELKISAKEIELLLLKLRTTALKTVRNTKTHKITTIGGLIDLGELIEPEETEEGVYFIEYTFNKLFSRIFKNSNYWALIDKQIIEGFSSKYSLLLYQYLQSVINLTHIREKTFTLDEARAFFGVGNKLPSFKSFNNRVITTVIKEINQKCDISLEVSYKKTVRKITHVTISWHKKNTENLQIKNTCFPFPNNGSIEFNNYWLDLKAQTDCNLDNHLLANEFRDFCLRKKIPLNNKNIAKVFVGFCKKIKLNDYNKKA